MSAWLRGELVGRLCSPSIHLPTTTPSPPFLSLNRPPFARTDTPTVSPFLPIARLRFDVSAHERIPSPFSPRSDSSPRPSLVPQSPHPRSRLGNPVDMLCTPFPAGDHLCDRDQPSRLASRCRSRPASSFTLCSAPLALDPNVHLPFAARSHNQG